MLDFATWRHGPRATVKHSELRYIVNDLGTLQAVKKVAVVVVVDAMHSILSAFQTYRSRLQLFQA